MVLKSLFVSLGSITKSKRVQKQGATTAMVDWTPIDIGFTEPVISLDTNVYVLQYMHMTNIYDVLYVNV